MSLCVTVNLAAQAYPVYIGQYIYADIDLLKKHIAGHQVMIVTQEMIAAHYLPRLLQSLIGYQCDVFYLSQGESYKTILEWQKIIDALLQQGHERGTTLIALGGGVVGDMTGFAAACYQRGVSYVQIPTSLIAQVDAAIGGKTAVNHGGAKNMIGAFYQPKAVITDVNLLASLPDREYAAGLAEVLKYALIADAGFFIWLEENLAKVLAKDSSTVLSMVARCAQIKASFVADDETEQGRRSLLNFGHTFGHAIEAAAAYHDVLHGEAVGLGMLWATDLSLAIGYLSGQDAERIKKALRQFGLARLNIPLPSAKELLVLMQSDKKRQQGENQFIVLRQIGVAEKISGVSSELLQKIITRDRL